MMRAVGYLVVFCALATAGLVYFDVINLSGHVSASVTDATKARLDEAANNLRTKAADRIRPSK